ncbi:BolA protein [Paucimonas lemoignei]|uniref:BolA protein n=1 Tax=Paucimonas lemoignei TaxID=29443 RepID=A0A4R3I3I0_PAULE|nr:BolA family protein [Paucimonas lemoignei]TCS39245.1 BolA protein [Paucimonas lemoignei]
MSPREERILSLVSQAFSPLECRLEDDSSKHAGHAGAASGAGHYRLRLVSTRFEGQNRITRHRLVYDCLRDLMQTEIHALNITALAPSEIQQ